MSKRAGQAAESDSSNSSQLTVAAVTAIVTVIVLAICAAAGSWTTVSGLAAAHGIRAGWLAPVEIDGGLVGVIALDIALTWADRAMWWLRLAARVFAAGTVLANAAAGWPSLVGAGLHCAAPLVIVVVTEAGRAALLYPARAEERKARKDARDVRRSVRLARRETRRARNTDPIPVVRWLLDPLGTGALWRRMKLWGETSYTAAVSMELERRAAISELTTLYGADGWRSQVPADLVWMLTAGVRMPVALDRVRALIEVLGQSADVPAVSDGHDDASGTGSPAVTRRRNAGDGQGGHGGHRARHRADSETTRRARELLREHPELARPGKGAEVGRKLGVSESTGRRELKRLLEEGAGPAAGDGQPQPE